MIILQNSFHKNTLYDQSTLIWEFFAFFQFGQFNMMIFCVMPHYNCTLSFLSILNIYFNLLVNNCAFNVLNRSNLSSSLQFVPLLIFLDYSLLQIISTPIRFNQCACFFLITSISFFSVAILVNSSSLSLVRSILQQSFFSTTKFQNNLSTFIYFFGCSRFIVI